MGMAHGIRTLLSCKIGSGILVLVLPNLPNLANFLIHLKLVIFLGTFKIGDKLLKQIRILPAQNYT